jgi:Xanthine and CO dehydrogenases maturation factor, XdhC/CoxF family
METIGFAEEIHRLISDGRAFVTATVVKTEGSSLAKPGFKVVVMDGNIVYGTLGGACPESVILDAASEVMESGFPRTIRIHLEESGKGLNAIISRKMPDEVSVETFCGGVMDCYS